MERKKSSWLRLAARGDKDAGAAHMGGAGRRLACGGELAGSMVTWTGPRDEVLCWVGSAR
jgi:hypothetical protein